MSTTIRTDSNSTLATGLTVEAAASSIADILARESGETGREDDDPASGAEAEAEADEADETEGETQSEEAPEEGADEPDAEEEEAAEGEDEEPEPDPATASAITVEIDGKTVTLTKDEVAKGYLRTEDYTRKTQALSEERRTFSQQAQAVIQERQQYAALLPALKQQIESLLPQEPNWEELAQVDPVEFNRQWAAKQLRDQKLGAIQQEQQRLQMLTQQETEAQTSQQIAAERERLVAANPRWSDPARWKEDRSAARNYLSGYGYTDAEISAVTDHRAVVIAHKARLYDEAMKKGTPVKQAARPSAPQPVRPAAPAPSRPGNSVTRGTVSELTRAKQRLAKTHSLSDAAAVIERLL